MRPRNTKARRSVTKYWPIRPPMDWVRQYCREVKFYRNFRSNKYSMQKNPPKFHLKPSGWKKKMDRSIISSNISKATTMIYPGASQNRQSRLFTSHFFPWFHFLSRLSRHIRCDGDQDDKCPTFTNITVSFRHKDHADPCVDF